MYFKSDYTEGAHPKLLEALAETNLVSQSGYGEDCFCAAAREKIRRACGREEAQVWFLTGGTQTNQVVISALLRRWEGVLCADTGHVAVHEAGAIEYTGHKVLTVPAAEGKLRVEDAAAYVESFYKNGSHEHMVFPGLVYISHPTELGTLYTKAELTALSAFCRANRLPLFLDGARLGYGLTAPGTDLTLEDIAELTDVFSVGGTKVGALCGEAVVFPRGNLPEHFATLTKQQRAMLAKGRLLGVQFDALFTDGLYFTIARGAVAQALRLKEAFRRKGYPLYIDSPTNQQFVILTPEQSARLGREVVFEPWENLPDGRAAVRFATSWATTDEQVENLIAML